MVHDNNSVGIDVNELEGFRTIGNTNVDGGMPSFLQLGATVFWAKDPGLATEDSQFRVVSIPLEESFEGCRH